MADTNLVLSSPSSRCWVDKTGPEDVLSGRGTGPNDHEGNVRFRNIVKRRKTDYNASRNRREKTKIAQEIVSATRENGARFLRKANANERERLGIPEETEEAWLRMDDDAVLEKTKQALRSKGDSITGKREKPRKRFKHSRQKTSPEPSQEQSRAHVEPRIVDLTGDLHVPNDYDTEPLDWRPSPPQYINQSESCVAQWEGTHTSGVYRASADWKHDEPLMARSVSVNEDEREEEFFGRRFHPYSFQGNNSA